MPMDVAIAPPTSARFAQCALVLCATSLVAACSHLPSGGLQDALDALTPEAPTTRTPLQLAPAPRPSLRVGDTFVYGTASVRQVVAASPTSLTWTDRNGEQRFRSGPDFFTPLLEQTLPDRQIHSRLNGRAAALWPLKAGQKVSFEERRTTLFPALRREVSTTLRWDCSVVDTRLSQVPAGDFETYHVVCKSYRSGWFLPLQTVTWDYAPSLGHYVRRTWFEGSDAREAVLAAALPAPLATPARIASTLERLQRQMQAP